MRLSVCDLDPQGRHSTRRAPGIGDRHDHPHAAGWTGFVQGGIRAPSDIPDPLGGLAVPD